MNALVHVVIKSEFQGHRSTQLVFMGPAFGVYNLIMIIIIICWLCCLNATRMATTIKLYENRNYILHWCPRPGGGPCVSESGGFNLCIVSLSIFNIKNANKQIILMRVAELQTHNIEIKNGRNNCSVWSRCDAHFIFGCCFIIQFCINAPYIGVLRLKMNWFNLWYSASNVWSNIASAISFTILLVIHKKSIDVVAVFG